MFARLYPFLRQLALDLFDGVNEASELGEKHAGDVLSESIPLPFQSFDFRISGSSLGRSI